MTLFIYLSFLLLSPTTLSETIYWDGGGNDNLWSNPQNWVDDQLPAFNDDVIIDGPFDVSFMTDEYTVESVELKNGALLTIMEGKSLTTTKGGFSGSDGVHLSGTIDQVSKIQINGTLNIGMADANGDAIDVSVNSLLEISSTGLLNITDAGNDGMEITGTVLNYGTIHIDDTHNSGIKTTGNSNDPDLIHNFAGATITLSNTSSKTIDMGGEIPFINEGTVNILGATNIVFSSAEAPFTNSGMFNASGTIKTEYFINAAGGSIAISDPVKELEFDDTPATDFSNNTLYFDLEGSIAIDEHDQISVKEGELILQNAQLEISGIYTPEIGDEFLLIRKFGSGPITGTFTNLPEGTGFFANGAYFVISYEGGNGNDLLLTAQQSPLADIDNDGYFNDEDCDDFNADINPAAVEIPNNDVDEDCDGIALIIDADNDGFNSDEDCDDTNSAINPDAIEIPNNDIDEDCDGIALIIDADNDGFNSNEDCDDFNNTINPAAEEIPNNGIDEDCDGMDLLTGINDLNTFDIKVFPNPTKGLVQVFIGNNNATTLSLKDMNGRVLLEENFESEAVLDLNGFGAGVYLLVVQAADSIGVARVVKID